jgi:hypothetical protein
MVLGTCAEDIGQRSPPILGTTQEGIEMLLIIDRTAIGDETIDDCGRGSGDKSEAVAYWVSRLDFRAMLTKEAGGSETAALAQVRRCLTGYGAWDEEQLADDDANIERLFWCICSNLADTDDSDFCVE